MLEPAPWRATPSKVAGGLYYPERVEDRPTTVWEAFGRWLVWDVVLCYLYAPPHGESVALGGDDPDQGNLGGGGNVEAAVTERMHTLTHAHTHAAQLHRSRARRCTIPARCASQPSHSHRSTCQPFAP